MNKDKEVKIGERVLHGKGTVLSLNAQDAVERINGKPVLADGIADSVGDLTKRAGLKGKVVTIEPTGFEQIAFWITALAPLLLLGGILGAYRNSKFRRYVAGRHLSNLLRAVLPGALSGRACRLGSGRALHSRNGARPDRDTVLRAQHDRFRCVGVFLILASLLWTMIDRYPGQNFSRQEICWRFRCLTCSSRSSDRSSSSRCSRGICHAQVFTADSP